MEYLVYGKESHSNIILFKSNKANENLSENSADELIESFASFIPSN